MEQFDAIGLTETWTKEGTWTKMNNKVSKKFEWFCILAERENTKGIVVAIKRDLKEVKNKVLSKGMIEVSFQHSNKKWGMITLYSQNIKEMMELLLAASKGREGRIYVNKRGLQREDR